MGLFTGHQKKSANTVYEEEVKPLLKSDGMIHVLMLNSFSKFVNVFLGAEDKYTNQIDLILTKMQEDGYEIIDIKFNSLKNQGITEDMEGFHTLITYK
jgi:hypothetical protein